MNSTVVAHGQSTSSLREKEVRFEMNRYHQARRMIAMAACAGVTVAGGLIGSSTAMATPVTCENVDASGSSLQNDAQNNLWIKAFPSFSGSSCTSTPTITYTKTSSGAGLEEFGNGGSGFVTKEDPHAGSEVLDGYVGTDDAPNAGDLGNAETAATEATLVELTIPVAQAPVAVILSLPVACSIAENGRVNIQNAYLDELWSGKVPAGGSDPNSTPAGQPYAANTWGAFFALIGQAGVTDSGTGGGTGCETPISLQVRSTASGTSYAFKSYLNQVDSTEWGQYASDYDFWPATTDNEGNASGGNLATDTAKRPGSVGYANTADAAGISETAFSGKAVAVTDGGSASHQILWAQIQNNGKEVTGAGYGSPKAASGNIGNCATAKDTPSESGAPYSVTDSWSGVLASDPNATHDLGGNYYSICALTYDLSWKHYGGPGLAAYYNKGTTVEGIEATVKAYLTFVTSSGAGEGQSLANNDYYSQLPTPLLPKAQEAAAYIGL
jgi:ABC-type phosphate transport system substrate-binding protein